MIRTIGQTGFLYDEKSSAVHRYYACVCTPHFPGKKQARYSPGFSPSRSGRAKHTLLNRSHRKIALTCALFPEIPLKNPENPSPFPVVSGGDFSGGIPGQPPTRSAVRSALRVVILVRRKIRENRGCTTVAGWAVDVLLWFVFL